MLTANFHTHSTFCDGTSAPEETVRRAIALGFTALGFSSHVDIDPVIDIGAYTKEICRLKEAYADRIEILCGGEVDRLYPDKDGLELDYRIGSNHFLEMDDGRVLSVDYTEERFLTLLSGYFHGDVYALTGQYFESVSRLYRETKCDFIGHFDLVTKYNNHLRLIDEDDPRYYAPACEAMERIVSEGMRYFEINTRMAASGRLYPSQRLLERLRALGGEILINSDAHNASELNRGFEDAVALARRCGFDHTNYLTMKSGQLEYVPVEI